MKRIHSLYILSFTLLLTLVVSIPANAATGPLCYVDAGAGGANNGDSWADAYPDLQAALTDPYCLEIWVAAGVYKPDSLRSDSFALKNNLAVYGGFAGAETFLAQRDWQRNITILSGDIDDNDVNTDGNNIAESTADIVGNNSYHVVIGGYTNNTALLDGFIITAGQGNSLTFPDDRAGGIYVTSGNPTLQNLVFSGNYASTSGGAIYNYSGGNPTISNTMFVGNASGGYGGAIDNYSGSDPTLTNVVFSGNTALNDGGALRNIDSWPTLVNVTFSGNTAGGSGGAIYNGGVGTTVLIKNGVIWGNTAGSAGHNIYNDGSTVNISYSNIDDCGGSGGGWDSACGTDIGSNIDSAPLFIDADGADNIVGTRDDNLRLSFGSPSIETGTNVGCPTNDLDNLPRPADADDDTFSMCDMGAYEAGSMTCGIALGPYTFNTQSNVEIIVDNLGSNLGCLYVDEMGINHPNATGSPGNNGIATSRYWLIRGLKSDKSTDAATDFVVTLTLPQDSLPGPKVCKYPGGLGGAGWDCDATTSTSTTVTRSGISSFSDWAVGSNVGPTAVNLTSFAETKASLPNSVLVGGVMLGMSLFTGFLLGMSRKRSRA